jgi:hypothetical protein
LRHRDGGLHAVDHGDGMKEWYVNGKLHRSDGPAVMWHSYTAWYINGEKHRADGPAVIFRNGTKEWWNSGFLHKYNIRAIE